MSESSGPKRQSSRVVRRAPILGVVIAVLVAGGVADRTAGHPAASTGAVVPPVPVAAPAAALSSSWFCAGAGNGTTGGEAGSIVIANAGQAPVQAAVDIVSAPASTSSPTPPAQKSTVIVPARSSAATAETAPAAGQWAGAIVDVNAGSVAVSQVLDGPLGRSSQPCASSGSAAWYFPYGQTRINADETILLLNPYPTDSIVDMSFSTNQGIEQPQALQGVDVPPGGLVAEDLGSEMRRRPTIAATVTARQGRVVAWEVFGVTAPHAGQPILGTTAGSAALADPALPVAGLTASLGAAAPSTSWVWPDGLAGGGIDEQYVIYNPGPDTADLRLSVGLSQGAAEPFLLTVGPYEVVPIVSEQQARIPAGVPHAATLVSTDGVPVIATRVVTADGGSTPGGAITGLGNLLGQQMAVSRWLVPAPSTDANHRGELVVYNASAAVQRVVVSILGTAGDTPLATAMSLPAGARGEVDIPAGTAQPLLVKASGAVYVEYDLFGVGGTAGASLSAGVPLG